MKVEIGAAELEYPGQLEPLRDSSDLLGDVSALKARMKEDGYLWIRGLLDREVVMKGRQQFLNYLGEHGALKNGEPTIEGVMDPDGKHVQTMGYRGLTHHPNVKMVLESERLFDFWEQWFGEPALTFDYKWLRAVANQGCSGAHYDFVYMGEGSPDLHTCWIPFADIPVEHGTLAICHGSHNLPSFEKLRNTYGKMNVDRDRVQGWFSRDPLEITDAFGGQWLASPVEMGDVIMFGMHTMHMSTTNKTPRWRLSCDVRFQPASHPVDDRWIGEKPKAHSDHWTKGEGITMEEARAAWQV